MMEMSSMRMSEEGSEGRMSPRIRLIVVDFPALEGKD
jgi:hypothetical protein